MTSHYLQKPLSIDYSPQQPEDPQHSDQLARLCHACIAAILRKTKIIYWDRSNEVNDKTVPEIVTTGLFSIHDHDPMVLEARLKIQKNIYNEEQIKDAIDHKANIHLYVRVEANIHGDIDAAIQYHQQTREIPLGAKLTIRMNCVSQTIARRVLLFLPLYLHLAVAYSP